MNTDLCKEQWMINKNTIDSPFIAVEEAHCFSSVPNWYLPTIDNYEQQIADISCSPDRKMKPTYQERNIYQ